MPHPYLAITWGGRATIFGHRESHAYDCALARIVEWCGHLYGLRADSPLDGLEIEPTS